MECVLERYLGLSFVYICYLLNEMTNNSPILSGKKINNASTNALAEGCGLHFHFIRGLFLLPSRFIKVLLILKLLICSSGDTVTD